MFNDEDMDWTLAKFDANTTLVPLAIVPKCPKLLNDLFSCIVVVVVVDVDVADVAAGKFVTEVVRSISLLFVLLLLMMMSCCKFRLLPFIIAAEADADGAATAVWLVAVVVVCGCWSSTTSQ